jgi:hypothetical protein
MEFINKDFSFDEEYVGNNRVEDFDSVFLDIDCYEDDPTGKFYYMIRRSCDLNQFEHFLSVINLNPDILVDNFLASLHYTFKGNNKDLRFIKAYVEKAIQYGLDPTQTKIDFEDLYWYCSKNEKNYWNYLNKMGFLIPSYVFSIGKIDELIEKMEHVNNKIEFFQYVIVKDNKDSITKNFDYYLKYAYDKGYDYLKVFIKTIMEK